MLTEAPSIFASLDTATLLNGFLCHPTSWDDLEDRLLVAGIDVMEAAFGVVDCFAELSAITFLGVWVFDTLRDAFLLLFDEPDDRLTLSITITATETPNAINRFLSLGVITPSNLN